MCVQSLIVNKRVPETRVCFCGRCQHEHDAVCLCVVSWVCRSLTCFLVKFSLKCRQIKENHLLCRGVAQVNVFSGRILTKIQANQGEASAVSWVRRWLTYFLVQFSLKYSQINRNHLLCRGCGVWILRQCTGVCVHINLRQMLGQHSIIPRGLCV